MTDTTIVTIRLHAALLRAAQSLAEAYTPGCECETCRKQKRLVMKCVAAGAVLELQEE